MVESLEAELAALSGDEMVAAVGLGGAPAWVRRFGRRIFAVPSRPLGRVLARFDRRTGEAGIDVAAAEALSGFGARWRVHDPPPARGALLIVSNHPGSYDALALMAAIGRRDLMIVAADRRFLRAMPSVCRQLLFVPIDGRAPDEVPTRSAAVRRALRHLRAGGALLHYPAGRIEPDPEFLQPRDEPLGGWHPSAGALVRAAAAVEGRVAAAVVAGVHSVRAKQFPLTRLLERHGVTTFAPLLQVALPGFGGVEASVRFTAARAASEVAAGATSDAEITATLRAEAARLVERARSARSPAGAR